VISVELQRGAKLFRVSPKVLRLFETPFRSRWIFDVEIVARFICEPHRAGVNSLIHETPLELAWRFRVSRDLATPLGRLL
jgi:dolichyl-phosphate beta-glucosyltransferase